MSELEPRPKPGEVAPRHIPNEIVPVPIGEVRDFVHQALHGTSLVDPIAQYFTGWMAFEGRVRYTPVDDGHTLIELDVVGTRAAEMALFVQRRAEIDRFFVAIHDELDRRERRRPRPPAAGAVTDGS